jgi:hypothetical protein
MNKVRVVADGGQQAASSSDDLSGNGVAMRAVNPDCQLPAADCSLHVS